MEDDVCTECKRNYWGYYDEDENLRCAKSCPSDLYPSFRDRFCLPCNPIWGSCGVNDNYPCDRDEVAFCNSTSETTACLDECPTGHYSRRGWCHECADNCDSCTNGDTCKDCADFYRLNEDGGCVGTCEDDN